MRKESMVDDFRHYPVKGSYVVLHIDLSSIEYSRKSNKMLIHNLIRPYFCPGSIVPLHKHFSLKFKHFYL